VGLSPGTFIAATRCRALTLDIPPEARCGMEASAFAEFVKHVCIELREEAIAESRFNSFECLLRTGTLSPRFVRDILSDIV
jgi:hypothetical protein